MFIGGIAETIFNTLCWMWQALVETQLRDQGNLLWAYNLKFYRCFDGSLGLSIFLCVPEVQVWQLLIELTGLGRRHGWINLLTKMGRRLRGFVHGCLWNEMGRTIYLSDGSSQTLVKLAKHKNCTIKVWVTDYVILLTKIIWHNLMVMIIHT